MSRRSANAPSYRDEATRPSVVPASDPRELRLFRALDEDNDGRVSLEDFERAIVRAGLGLADPRLRESLEAFRSLSPPDPESGSAPPVSQRAEVCDALRPNISLIERALQGSLVIPDFGPFTIEVERIYRRVRTVDSGAVADYIPQLALTGEQADRFGVALCSVDGQRAVFGDGTARFSVQSTCKPILYCMALSEHGVDTVHRYVGHEPSGVGFNELTLDRRNRPHNPLINAGAIMCSSLISLTDKAHGANHGQRGWEGKRLDSVMDRFERLSGGERPQFGSSVYLSERRTADRNFALAYYMREKNAFPPGAELEDVLDFYFQSCSIELSAEMMSVVAATLANGGVCPTTGERVFSAETVQRCLSLMSSCGMYDYSGEFAFSVGLPAKSGVSGATMIVVPNVMGICTFAPKLDEHGNSVRGLEFARRLVRTFNLHSFDNLRGVPGKRDPRVNHSRFSAHRVIRLIWAASKGDVGAIQRQVSEGARLDCADYDRRTPLHLAAAEGRSDVVALFIEHVQSASGGDLSPEDRWGGTPLDDARDHGHHEVAGLLESHGARHGAVRRIGRGATTGEASPTMTDSEEAAEMIWAASLGDLNAIVRLVARGVQLESCDYDLRTPLHLAAAEGHANVVAYFIAQRIDPNPRDRWGNSPLSEARRHRHQDVASMLRQAGGIE